MKKFIITIFFLSILLVACNYENNSKNLNTGNETKQNTIHTKKKEKLYYKALLNERNIASVESSIKYINSSSYNIKVKIERDDDIKFIDKNQNIYVKMSICNPNLEVCSFVDVEDINEKYMQKIPLEDGKIPLLTEINIDENSDIFSKEEHKEILKQPGELYFSVEVRDPKGAIISVFNTIFN